jgi:hypothetical protein
MLDYLHGPVIHDAFFKKYASKKFLKGKLYLLYINIINDANALPLASMVVRNWVKANGPELLGSLPRSHPLNPKNKSR